MSVINHNNELVRPEYIYVTKSQYGGNIYLKVNSSFYELQASGYSNLKIDLNRGNTSLITLVKANSYVSVSSELKDHEYLEISFEKDKVFRYKNEKKELFKNYNYDALTKQLLSQRQEEVLKNYFYYNPYRYALQNHETLSLRYPLLRGKFHQKSFAVYELDHEKKPRRTQLNDQLEGSEVATISGVKQRIEFDCFDLHQDVQDQRKSVAVGFATSGYDKIAYLYFKLFMNGKSTGSNYHDLKKFKQANTYGYSVPYTQRLSNDNILVVFKFKYDFNTSRQMYHFGEGGYGKVSQASGVQEMYKFLIFDEIGSKVLNEKIFFLPLGYKEPDTYAERMPFRPSKFGFVVLLPCAAECIEIRNLDTSIGWGKPRLDSYGVANFDNFGELKQQKILKTQLNTNVKAPQLLDFTFREYKLIVKGLSYQEDIMNEPSFAYHILDSNGSEKSFSKSMNWNQFLDYGIVTIAGKTYDVTFGLDEEDFKLQPLEIE
ncbi:MAG: hypothetical protein ABJE80_22870 [Reichenbachiella sp.]|uniref:hypothetical protein n=1 Tax=Reichenbachiella sp. TaxID=2184521 RepID=UPI003267D60D